jgi:hypothetical protein
MKLSDLNLHDIGATIQMTGAVYSSAEKTYLVFFPTEGAAVPEGGIEGVPPFGDIDVLKMDHAEWEVFLRQTDVMEHEMFLRASDGTITKAIARKCERQISQQVSWRVFKRDGYQCRYCADNDTPLTVDHLVRYEEAGPSTEANLVAACKKCNRVRGNASYAQWLRHDYYRKVSKNLDDATRQANEAVAGTLDAIPRVVHMRTR